MSRCEYAPYPRHCSIYATYSLLRINVADVADAERALATFDAGARQLAGTEALARLLLRAESLASSRIEGLTIGAGRLLRAEWAQRNGVQESDATAREVLGNVEAMNYAVGSVGAGDEINVAMLLEMHRRLLEYTSLVRYAGVLRDRQNWIGGNAYNPMGADFVPPPEGDVRRLLEDLCAFCNGDELPAVAQAALAHAQFETIHPFADGNGRAGRALIHLVLRHRRLTTNVTPPISLVLATRAGDYIAGLRASRYIGAPDSDVAVSGTNRWVGTFAAACTRAVADAELFEARICELQDQWRTRLGPIRANSATALLVDVLPGSPVTSLAALTTQLARSLPRVTEAVDRFVNAGILQPVNVGRVRGQVYEAREVIDAFTGLERGRTIAELGDILPPALRRVSIAEMNHSKRRL